MKMKVNMNMNMNMILSLAPLVSRTAGILILIVPRLLNYIFVIIDHSPLDQAVRRERFSYPGIADAELPARMTVPRQRFVAPPIAC